MPFRGNGDWLLDYYHKAKANPKMYSFIGWEPNAKVQLGSTWMNHHVLGKKAIMQMEAEMEANAILVMIRNQQVNSWGNLFYPKLATLHWYTALATEVLISQPLGASFKRDASYDVGRDDYNPDMPLHLSHDWGVFNCITIDQEYPKELRFVNTMHVKNPMTIDDLADQFIEYYRMHKAKIAYQWGDKTGNNRQANAKLNYFEQFAERLRDKGWRVIQRKTGDVDQSERHRFISKLHSEEDTRLPRLRYNARCTDFRIAMESAPMKDQNKDKSSEHPDSGIKPEHATHYTDAHDYRVYHALKHREKGEAIDAYSMSLT